jgi:hypothetical protein
MQRLVCFIVGVLKTALARCSNKAQTVKARIANQWRRCEDNLARRRFAALRSACHAKGITAEIETALVSSSAGFHRGANCHKLPKKSAPNWLNLAHRFANFKAVQSTSARIGCLSSEAWKVFTVRGAEATARG